MTDPTPTPYAYTVIYLEGKITRFVHVSALTDSAEDLAKAAHIQASQIWFVFEGHCQPSPRWR